MRLINGDGQREWLSLSASAARLTADDWSAVTWPSPTGGHPLYAHLVATWIRKLGPTLLLITRPSLDAPLQSTRFWGGTRMDLDAQAFVDILAVRWEVEPCFEYQKDLLGSDHYQLMTATAVVRFWTLTACFLCFLEEGRASRDGPPLTCGDVRHALQDQHRSNLLHWLQAQFASGRTVAQLRAQFAL
ncbi:MAG: hypothetical protein M5U01_39725 [Ardenticatenaceae bacterium]|nr:hypothetical protein [Ardenticatenaceae bacterium]